MSITIDTHEFIKGFVNASKSKQIVLKNKLKLLLKPLLKLLKNYKNLTLTILLLKMI